MELNAFTILPQSLAAIYAYAAPATSVIIDIGHQKTEIIPVVDYEVIKFASITIPYGGQSINQSLATYLPNLSPAQIETLKKSDIYEVLSDDEKKKSFFGIDGLKQNNEDEFDVASIVTSNKSTREILEEREKQKQGEQVANSKLEKNTFHDEDNNEITVGKERFKGSEEIITKISESLAKSLSKLNDLEKRQASWDSIIVIGKTSRIEGFLEALNSKIIEDHLVGKEFANQSAATAAFHANSSTGSSVHFNQVPNSIKFIKMPEYFPEWKKQGFADVHFLGGQIVSKQIFGTRNESMFVTRSNYNEKGPLSIWDIAF
jgi:actin-related protein 9